MAIFKTGKSLEKLSSIKHGFFGSAGGVSSGLYRSLNCGTYSDDDSGNVIKNRALALNILSQGATLIEIHQTHSSIAQIIDDDLCITDCDAVVSKRKNIALSIVTADCAPILFADQKAEIIAAAHAGWQGVNTGIIENTIVKMCSIGAKRNDITATIGPCIAQRSYEVGPKFYLKINDDRFFIKSHKQSHYLFDLRAYIISKLTTSQIANVECLEYDTYDDKNGYFSYRRKTHLGEKDYGRQISMIMMI